MLTSATVISAPPSRRDSLMEGIPYRFSCQSPCLCVDGYMFVCQYDGETCTPVFGIKLEDLLKAVHDEQDALRKNASEVTEMSTSRAATPTRSDFDLSYYSPSGSAPSLRSANSRPKSHSFVAFRRSASLSKTRRRISSDQEDFLGISYENLEHPLRSSFLVPIVNNNLVSSANADLGNAFSASRQPKAGPLLRIGDASKHEEYESKHEDYEKIISWVEKHSDYVNTETVANTDDLALLIQALLKASDAVLLTIKINSDTEMIVTYQVMQKFKHDYMVVKINEGYAMLMKAF